MRRTSLCVRLRRVCFVVPILQKLSINLLLLLYLDFTRNYQNVQMSLVAAMCLTLSCPFGKATGVKGQLILQTGQTGDVRNCRVRLFVSQDLTGSPVKEVASEATGVDETKSDFLFEDVLAGYYYLLAWKDLNGSGKVDHLDLVGVYGGTYRPGYGGSQLTVQEGKITDVGQIVMMIYKELQLSVSATRDANGWITFTYSFNDDCDVTSWSFTGPAGIQASDTDQVGHKTANTQYQSSGWRYEDGTPLPSGTYTITVMGSYGGDAFTLVATVNI